MVVAQAVAADPWRFQAHPEVWALIAFLGVAYWYAVTRIGPRVTRADETVVTRSQVAWFGAGLLTLWVASDWPVHDIAEQYLYSVHMSQHLLLSFVAPPLFLLGTPTWLVRLVVGDGRGYAVLKRLARPIPATVAFNAVVVFSHWPTIVNNVVDNAPLHYGVHVVVMASALLVWLPVCGPIPELRFTWPMQMVHLFLQSIIPTVPAGWLTFADKVVYRSYDVPTRVWGLPAVEDQQVAALLMKVVGGTYLWIIITILFVRYATKEHVDDRARGMEPDRRSPVLTWEQVERQLQEAGPAPAEPVPPT